MKRKFFKILMFMCIIVFFIATYGCKKSFDVTFDVGDGSFSYSKIQVTKGSTIDEKILNTLPTLDGFVFDYWYEKDTMDIWDSTKKVNKNITLVAKWEKQVEIEYILDGGINNPNNPRYFQKNAVLYDATKEGYNFLYWEYLGEKITKLPSNNVTEITLIARYELAGPKVIYELDGGTNDSRNALFYEPGSTLYAPQKLGYKFLNWTYNGEVVTEIPESDNDIVLVANYSLLEFTITYDLDGGINSPNNPVKFTVLDLPLELENPTFEGKTFLGWYYNNQKIVGIPKSEAFCTDLTLTAKFEIHYKITYDGCEGIDTSTFPTTYVSSRGLVLPTPVKKGYDFVGWNFNSAIISQIPSGTTGDITISPIFDLATYDITYDLDGGVNSRLNPKNYTINSLNMVLREPTKKGYIFKGWMCDGEYITEIKPSMARDLTIKAIWEKEATYYKIEYVLNGGEVDSGVMNRYEEGVETILAIPSKAGYKFLGWNTKPDGSGEYVTKINAGENTDKVFYAMWSKNVIKHKIIYNLDGGTLSNFKEEYVEGETYVLPSPKKTGYTFIGWYLTEDFVDEAILEISEYAKKDVVLYAKFETNDPIYKIHYSMNGGTFVDDNIIYEFTRKSETIILPSLIRDGYTFVGWIDDSDEIITQIEKGTEQDIYIRASFTSTKTTYKITYILNGGEISSDAIYLYSEDEQITLPTAYIEGTNFVGWYKTPNFSDDAMKVISRGTKMNLVLYARYEEAKYQITLNVDDDIYSVISYTPLTDSFDLDGVTKPGYNFIGWYNEEGQKIETIYKGTACNMNLYALFVADIDESITHTVTFIDYNQTVFSEVEVIHGMTVSKRVVGSVLGLALEWYLDGYIFDFDTIITEDIKLYAKWSVIDEIFASIFTEPKIKDDLQIRTTFSTVGGEISVRWSSDKPAFINMINGTVNLDYEETIVKVLGDFSLGGIVFGVTKEIIVDKLDFCDLSTTKPAIGYFYSRTASIPIPQVTIDTLDIINYGFARVNDDFTVNINELTSIARITALRKKGIRVLLCFGGYGTAGIQFSAAAKTKAGRQKLANSMLETIKKYHFDGVDIDWEYPGYETGTDVSIDRPNYTLLMEEISRTLKEDNPEYLVTAALPGGKYGYTRYELKKVGEILDYVNLMTYDLQSSNVSTHHTALYNSGSYTPHGSIEQTVELYSIQIPKKKLIIGLAFYGRKFAIESSDSGIGKSNLYSEASAITYTNIYNNYLVKIANGSQTIKRYWDDIAKAPYIYDGSTWISYDDPESIKYKCKYVLDNDLGGLMFWDYGEDETLQLIQAIHDNYR